MKDFFCSAIPRGGREIVSGKRKVNGKRKDNGKRGYVRPDYFRGELFQRAALCRGEQLLLTFFGEGSRQLKLIRASLSVLGVEWNRRPFSDRGLSAEVSVKKLRSQIACPDSGSGLVLNNFGAFAIDP